MNRTMVVDLDMLKRYDRPGPRYTSYPTAPYFTPEFGREAFALEIDRSNEEKTPSDLSLYFHLPFCDTLCYFCGCNMIITSNRNRIDEYLDYLSREIELVSSRLNKGRRVAQIHWGGGTPTYLDAEQIKRIFSVIRDNFDFYDDAEIGVEIDPRGLNDDVLDALQEVGFNRASMGVQDFNEEVQTAINRLQSEEITVGVFRGLRERGFESINLDLIYGLPLQTVSSFERTLDRIIEISPDRLAVFNYAHVPWLKKHQRVIREQDLPEASVRLEILKSTIEKLTSSSYVYIGMDHFAKPEDSLTKAYKEKKLYRNFQGYSTHWGCDLYAFGMSSISQLDRVYAQNVKALRDYYGAVDHGRLATERGYRLTADDEIRRFVITKLMCDFELKKQQVEEKFDLVFDTYFGDALARLEPFVRDGLVRLSAGRIDLSAMGHLVIRNIAMAFDKYLNDKDNKNKPKYSRTI